MNLSVGRARVSLRFRRGSDGDTEFEILNQQGELRVERHPDPWRTLDESGKQMEDAQV
ncbi:MAG: hypothetical protein JO071_13750 [Deltaproteobacteria bacterium]|nr:hypothetical protein [Deltaproteobacteria bacterium]